MLLASLGLLFGCASRSQIELAADARAGAQAYQAEADPAKQAVIATGLASTVIAATDDIHKLPPPAMTPQQIQADPAAYAAAGADAQADPPPYIPIEQPGPPKPGPADILREIGEQALRWGTWAAIAGLVAMLLRFVPWWGIGAIFSWGPLSTIAGLSASLGSAATVTGTAAMWLSDYLWIVVAAVALSAVGVAIFHLPSLRQLRDRIAGAPRRLLSSLNKPQPKP
jgi:hypothetical protein